MYLTFFFIIVFAAFAMTVQQGVWNNMITAIAILIGGVIAFGAHQPVAVMLDEWTGGSYTYLIDFVVLWMIFTITTGLIKQIAQLLSRNRVNFNEKFDNGFGALVGLGAAFNLASFAMATFHCAPFAYDQMGGAFEHGDTVSEVEASLASKSGPDVRWLSTVDLMLDPSALGAAGFQSKIWVQQHGQHRKTFQDLDTSIVDR